MRDKENNLISINSLVRLIVRKKAWILSGLITGFAISLLISTVILKPLYRAEALLLPTDMGAMSSLSSMLSEFGGIASLAGIDLAGDDIGSNTSIAIEIIQSKMFAEKFIKKYELLPMLMAVKGWDIEDDTPIYDTSDYIVNENKWTRDVDYPQSVIPSLSEYHERFMEIVTIKEDEDTGFVILAVEYFSPVVAKLWVDLIIQEINELMLERDVQQANLSIDYITNQIESTAIPDLNVAFYKIIEEQHKTIMLAYSRPAYVFEAIDPAIVDYEIIFPQIIWFLLTGILAGTFIPILIILSTYSRHNEFD